MKRGRVLRAVDEDAGQRDACVAADDAPHVPIPGRSPNPATSKAMRIDFLLLVEIVTARAIG